MALSRDKEKLPERDGENNDIEVGLAKY